MTIQISKHSITIDLLVITLLWCLAVAVVKPAGDFPLNDDWSYGLAVKRLIEDKVFHPTGWTAMPLLSQVLWGDLFCLPCGFSFTALRFSTITLALFGILGLYLLIRGLDYSRWLALVAALTLAFNPIYFALSHTFMTDVPFTAFSILALLFLLQNLWRSCRLLYLHKGHGGASQAFRFERDNLAEGNEIALTPAYQIAYKQLNRYSLPGFVFGAIFYTAQSNLPLLSQRPKLA